MKFVFNPFTSNFDITASSPGDISGGTANSVAGFDANGVLESIPNWGISPITGGADINLTVAEADTNATRVINNLVNTIAPTNDLVNLNYQGLQNYSYVNGPNDSASVIGLNNGLNLGTGNHNNSIVLNQSLDANAGTSDNLYLVNQYMALRTGHTNAVGTTVLNQAYNLDAGATQNGNVLGFNQNITIDGDLNAQINAISSSTNVNTDITPFGINSLTLNDSLAAASQYFNGLSTGLQVNSGGSFVNGINLIGASLNIQSGGAVDNGAVGVQISGNINAGASLASGFTSFNAGLNFSDGITGVGVQSINLGHNIATGSNYVNGVFDSTQFQSGGVLVNGYTGFSSNPNFQSGSGAQYITNFQAGGAVGAGATVDNIANFQVAIQINDNISSLSGLDINPNGSGTITNVTGVSVNLSNVTTSGRKVGLNINDGIINAGGTVAAPFNPGVDSINTIVPTISIPNGSPSTGTTVFGHNLANLLFADDDFGAGPLGVSLGAVGYLGQIQVATGKTVDAISMAIGGAQFSGDGTTTDFSIYNALGALPGSGTPIITNVYGFKDGGLLSALAVNSWGIHISDANAENFLKRLAIDTATQKVTAGKVVEVNGDTLLDGDLQVSGLSQGLTESDASGNVSTIANGTNGDVLTMVAGTPAWAAPAPAATNYDVSATCSIANISSTSFVDVTNLEVTNFVATGNPVTFMLIADGDTTSGNCGCVRIQNSSGNTAQVEVAFLVDGTIVGQQSYQVSDSGLTDILEEIPGTAFQHVNIPSAGTHDFKIQARAVAPTTNVGFRYLKLYIKEG